MIEIRKKGHIKAKRLCNIVFKFTDNLNSIYHCVKYRNFTYFAFPQNFQTWKLGEITVFYAVHDGWQFEIHYINIWLMELDLGK